MCLLQRQGESAVKLASCCPPYFLLPYFHCATELLIGLDKLTRPWLPLRIETGSIYASCWVAFLSTLAARRGALTSRAFLCLQIVTPAMMPMTTKNLNTVAGWYPNCPMVLTTCTTGAD